MQARQACQGQSLFCRSGNIIIIISSSSSLQASLQEGVRLKLQAMAAAAAAYLLPMTLLDTLHLQRGAVSSQQQQQKPQQQREQQGSLLLQQQQQCQQ
jgi:hypothetical protein